SRLVPPSGPGPARQLVDPHPRVRMLIDVTPPALGAAVFFRLDQEVVDMVVHAGPPRADDVHVPHPSLLQCVEEMGREYGLHLLSPRTFVHFSAVAARAGPARCARNSF